MAKEKVVKVVLERHIPLFRKECAVCGRKFEGTKTAKYCSIACRQRADYIRHAETRREERRKRYRETKNK